VPAIRNRYRAQRDAMLQALEENFQSNESKEQGTFSQTVEWNTSTSPWGDGRRLSI
jgi:DNA-binding transcriptional MocR family regulator